LGAATITANDALANAHRELVNSEFSYDLVAEGNLQGVLKIKQRFGNIFVGKFGLDRHPRLPVDRHDEIDLPLIRHS
jgi:hypothetical protein